MSKVKKFKARIPFSVSIKGVDSVEYKKGATIAEEHLPMCHTSLITEIKEVEAKQTVENKVPNVDKEAEARAKALEEAEARAKALEEAKQAVENAKQAVEAAKNANDKKSAEKVLEDAEAKLAELEK